MAERPGDPEQLGRVEANRQVLTRLAEGVERSKGGPGPWSPDGWVMRTHPDVTDALGGVAPDDLRMVYGIATLVDADDRIYAVMRGTGYLWVRQSAASDEAPGGVVRPAGGLAGWVEVRDWDGRLDDLVRASAAVVREAVRHA